MKRSMILRQLMINRDMKVSDISRLSGIAYSTVKSILENGTGKASYINICKICASLGITPDDLEHMVKENTIHEFQLSKEDSELLSKYRSLDDPGRAHVDTVLDWEAKRTTQAKEASDQIKALKEQAATIPLAREPEPDYLAVNAAHARTDLDESESTPELAQLEEDIMDDENF